MIINTFVCIEAGAKEIHVSVFRNDESLINHSYPYDSGKLENGKAIGKAVMWFGKDLDNVDNRSLLEEENGKDGVYVFRGEEECIIVTKDGDKRSTQKSSSLIEEALQFIKSEIDMESKTVFTDTNAPFDWKNTKVGITSRLTMTFQLKDIMKRVFKESNCEVVFVNYCLTAISEDYNCYRIVGFGISKEPVEVDLSNGSPKKSITLVDSTCGYESKEDATVVTPEMVAGALNGFLKKRSRFNDVDPIRISLLEMKSVKCIYDSRFLQDSLELLPPKDPCTSIPLVFQLYAVNTNVKQIVSTSIELSKELCLPTEAITSKAITLSFTYAEHVLTVSCVYDWYHQKQEVQMDLPLPEEFVQCINTSKREMKNSYSCLFSFNGESH